jgi:hypothetical protein
MDRDAILETEGAHLAYQPRSVGDQRPRAKSLCKASSVCSYYGLLASVHTIGFLGLVQNLSATK